MATIPYSSFDFSSIQQALINQISSDPNFTDYNIEGSNLNQIIGLISVVGDLFNFYINQIANETFIETATMYENLNKISRLVGYGPTGYQSSTVTVSLSASGYPTSSYSGNLITLPQYSLFKASSVTPTGDTVYFTNANQELYIVPSSGSVQFNVPLVQGQATTVQFNSTNDTFQSFEINDLYSTEANLVVQINNETWTKYNSLFDMNSSTKGYTTRYDKNQKVQINFGDGTYGAIPANTTINITYIKTLGSIGNVAANQISLVDTITDDHGNQVTFIVVQNDISRGGADPLTTEQVRNYAHANYRTQNRVVSKQDYKDQIISNFSQDVQDVMVLNFNDYLLLNTPDSTSTITISGSSGGSMIMPTYNYSTTIDPNIYGTLYIPNPYYNNIYLYIVPTNGDYVTIDLQNNIDEFLENMKMATINHIYENINYNYIDVNIQWHYDTTVNSSITPATTVQNNINNYINNYFAKSNLTIGQLIEYSQIMSGIQAISGVAWCILTLNGSASNVILNNYEFPKLNSLTVTSI